MLTCVKITDNSKHTKSDIKLGRNESRDVYIMGGFKAHTADLSKHNRFRSRSRQRKYGRCICPLSQHKYTTQCHSFSSLIDVKFKKIKITIKPKINDIIVTISNILT